MRSFWLLVSWLSFPTFLFAQGAYADPELTDKDRQHWSFKPPTRPAIPPGANSAIDAFLLHELKAKGLEFSPEADRRTLIIRLTLDLHGLPPTLEEVDAFLKDDKPNAYDTLVDRLLASPHYGERQAQHWLDVVRFAESNGYELDADRPNAWRYRDYVIRSFNSDKPYGQFVREQIAGDLMADGKDKKRDEEFYIATGFYRCGPVHVVSGNLDPAVVRQEVLTEMVNGIGSAVLGLTVNCARCHDHKFDPISAGDYYRLEAYLAGTRYLDRSLVSEKEKQAWKAKSAEVKKLTEPIRKKINVIDQPIREQLKKEKVDTLDEKTKVALATPKEKQTAAQKKLIKDAEGVLTVRWDEVLERLTPEQKKERDSLRNELFRIEGDLPAPLAEAWSVNEDEQPPSTFVLKRGDIKRRTIRVAPEPIRVVAKDKIGTSRIDLANWLTRPDHPLTARVIVNRLWQQHFGRGLVATPNDFGTRGAAPTHPQLLDWLATELVEKGELGGLKKIHRLIVTSNAYRQQAKLPLASDPSNQWLSRMFRLRLDAESIRDRMLAASGALNRQVGGPSVRVPLEPEVYDLIFTEDEPDHLWRVTADTKQYDRRSLYLYAKRNVRYPMLEVFDQPDGVNSCSVRGQSTYAPQSLIMMNGSMTKQMAERLIQKGVSNKDPIEIFRRVLLREPDEKEKQLLTSFVKSQTIREIAIAMYNTAEFVARP